MHKSTIRSLNLFFKVIVHVWANQLRNDISDNLMLLSKLLCKEHFCRCRLMTMYIIVNKKLLNDAFVSELF